MDNKGEYERYAQTKNGISPMAYPGKTIVKATSYEHDIRAIQQKMRNNYCNARQKIKKIQGNGKSPRQIRNSQSLWK